MKESSDHNKVKFLLDEEFFAELHRQLLRVRGAPNDGKSYVLIAMWLCNLKTKLPKVTLVEDEHSEERLFGGSPREEWCPMAGIREDYIERMIERLVAALAAILKAGKSQKTEEALDLVHQTSLSLFGMEYRMLITIDAGSVAGLLEHPEKIKALAKLVSAEAELLQQRGDTEGATHRLGHALALLQEAQLRRTNPDPETETLLRGVRDRLAQT